MYMDMGVGTDTEGNPSECLLWSIAGDGEEIWAFAEENDQDGKDRFEAFLKDFLSSTPPEGNEGP